MLTRPSSPHLHERSRLSSGGRFRRCAGLPESLDRVEGLAGLQAVVELAEHFVEQVTQGGGVPVAVVAAAAVVPAGGAGVDGSVGGPDPTDGGEPVVLDAAG